MKRMIDLHTHIVPGVDDGSRSIRESMLMLELSQKQGITDVFCTSHNGYSVEDGEKYLESYTALKQAIKNSNLDIRLHKGCEVLCAGDYMDDIIYGLDIGAFQTLADSKYVLTELYPDAKPSEALLIIKSLTEHDYKPIIAHMERNYNISGRMVGLLIQCGAMIQVNAISFEDEQDQELKNRARELLQNRYVHFIGSDSHRIDHRPPNLSSGIHYILQNADEEYAEAILCKNAEVIFGEPPKNS